MEGWSFLLGKAFTSVCLWSVESRKFELLYKDEGNRTSTGYVIYSRACRFIACRICISAWAFSVAYLYRRAMREPDTEIGRSVILTPFLCLFSSCRGVARCRYDDTHRFSHRKKSCANKVVQLLGLPPHYIAIEPMCIKFFKNRVSIHRCYIVSLVF